MLFGMTTLENNQLEGAVFEAFERIEPRTIGILTMSVKHRVRLCISRQGGFVGDSVEECCRRARVEFDSMNTVQSIPITQDGILGSEGREGEDGEDNQQDMPRLPSFRMAQ